MASQYQLNSTTRREQEERKFNNKLIYITNASNNNLLFFKEHCYMHGNTEVGYIHMADLNPNLNPYPHHVRVHVPLIYHRVQLVTHFCMLTEGAENCSMQFKTYRSRYVTRSNTLKIPNSRCHYDLRKYSFSWKLSTSGIVYHL